MSQQWDHLCPPCSAGDVKKGDFIIIKGHPCKVMETKHSKTGKHGHAKCNITGIDVLTGKKYNDVQPAHAGMNNAVVERKEYQFMDISDDRATCLTEDNETVEFDCNGSEEGKKLLEHYKENPDKVSEEEITVIVMVAPEMLDGKTVERREIIHEWKVKTN